MILHKYLDKYGIEVIRTLELKFNIPSKFNDPFEFLPRAINDWTIRTMKRKLKSKDFQSKLYFYFKSNNLVKNKKEFKAKLNQNNIAEGLIEGYKPEKIWKIIREMKHKADAVTRLTCFSSELKCEMDEILMWSHYSEKHSGFRFHFDSDLLVEKGERLLPVKYSKERAGFKLSLSLNHNLFSKQVHDVLITKSESWSYESEYRLFVFPQNCISKFKDGQTIYFKKFSPASLIRIDLGLFCDDNTMEMTLDELKKDELKHIHLYKSLIDQQEFKLDYECLK